VTQQIDEMPPMATLDGRYRLLEVVGHAGAARLYRAEDTLLGRPVAIKMMRGDANVLASPERLRNEANVLSSLAHPALVTLLDAHLPPGQPGYLVLEFVEGPTLAQRMKDGPLTLEQSARLAGELASGLQCVHAAGFVHRDVKPSNVILTPASLPAVPFHVKLADFSFAQLVDAPRVTTPGMVAGTAAYLAPEQVRGEPAGPPADIYALGLVLLEALTGQRPFGHDSGIGGVLARLLEPPGIPDGLGWAWAELLRRMTDCDPARRPAAEHVLRSVVEIHASSTVPTALITAATSPTPTIDVTHVGPRHRGRAMPASVVRRRLRAARVQTSAAGAAFLLLVGIVVAGASQQARPDITPPQHVAGPGPSQEVVTSLPDPPVPAGFTPDTGATGVNDDDAVTNSSPLAPARAGNGNPGGNGDLGGNGSAGNSRNGGNSGKGGNSGTAGHSGSSDPAGQASPESANAAPGQANQAETAGQEATPGLHGNGNQHGNGRGIGKGDSGHK
jgi:uncharacterized membrane protein YgcG